MMLSVCPICDEVAKAAHDRDGDGMRFNCDACGDFGISEASAFSMHRYASELRRSFLRAAAHRAEPGSVPVITHID
ncbi:hypothetical protein [Antarcticirhabdus aurantiaca]|uniref:Uncharacterized protein n=1 Tax=Antarcticirhabdus aurantiaca TaxID=2606717 RepID=A0ACD4NW55_9HYPH|nr:hypothetical protein [Antarcticirhabdus aurantiaca]WAJ30981.1 hypothetical protein OXU80_12570 [Jeongeuplla avenae]